MKIIEETLGQLTITLDKENNDFSILRNYPNVTKLIISSSGVPSNQDIKGIYDNSNIRSIIYNGVLFYPEKVVKEKDFTVLGYPYTYINYKDMYLKPKTHASIESALTFPKTEIYVYSITDLDIDAIKHLYELTDERLRKDFRLILANGDNYKFLFGDDKEITSIDAETDSFLDVKKVVSYFINNGFFVKDVNIKLKSSNYYNMDSSILDDIPSNININYGENISASLEDFKGLQASVNYYRRLILDAELSPVERVMFAYDIMKTFEYKENKDNLNESRYAHLIISTGNIVCVGYAHLMKEILSNLDDNINVSSFGCSCYDKDSTFLGGHQRSLVRVNDDKYNVHGIYALDATWDSDKSKKIMSDKYTALDLYRYFLVPRSLYKNIFPYDSVPDLFKFDTGEEFYEGFVGDSCKDLFPDMLVGKNKFVYSYKELISDEELRTWLDVQRPSLDMFNKMLLNVRMAEGYTKEEAMKEVEKVYLLNKKVIELSAANDKEIPFFEDDVIKK